MLQIVAFILLFVMTAAIVDLPSAALAAVAYFVGKYITVAFDKGFNKQLSHLYGILYLAGWCYMLMCYWYMTSHGYSWLLAFDTINSFIPKTEELINQNHGNLLQIYHDIFAEYDFFFWNSNIWYAYSCTWGVLINQIGATMYFGLQSSTLFIYGFVGVVLCKLFSQYGFDEEKSFNHTLVVCLCSIIFFYSSQILRDIHVLLTYLVAIYLSGKPNFSFSTLLCLVLVILASCGLRIETGLFLLITIPIYLLSTIQEGTNRAIAIFASIIVLVVGMGMFFSYMNSLLFVFEENSENYIEGIEEGSGIIARFQRIPVLGNFISIIYNLSLPMPCWGRMDPARNLVYGGNVSNIMNFARIPAVFLNVMMYVYVISWLFSNKIRNAVSSQLTKVHKWQLLVGVLFLYMQSAVISQRRLMGYYCIFYILLFVIFDNVTPEDRNKLNLMTLSVFCLLQIIGMVFFM